MRQKGEVALSRDLVSASMLLTGMLIFWGFEGFLADVPVQGTQSAWSQGAWLEMTPDAFLELWHAWVQRALFLVVPILAVVPITVALVSLLQTQFLFLPSRMAPDWKHVNPGAGMLRIFSLDSLAATAFGVAKVGFVAAFIFWMVLGQLPVLVSMYEMDFSMAVEKMRSIVLGTGLKIAAALFLLALADYGWQFYRHNQRLKMTYEQMKEEIKISEGDPNVKQRIRERMR